MAKTRRRSLTSRNFISDPKYGHRGNARGKRHTGSVGQSRRGGRPKETRG